MRLLVDLQRVSELLQSFSGCFEPDLIAKRTTDGLIEKFDCAFARIWLMEPDGTMLRLVASSGMYTNINGFFGRVPLGAFKVGKIAQNRIPFLSNNLADEPWVKDREWAIAKQITGFAGYPLCLADRVIGVLAVFSQKPLSSEFLEILQGLCTTLAITFETSLHFQQQQPHLPFPAPSLTNLPLSEQLAHILNHTRFMLVGTERLLSTALTFVLLRLAEVLRTMDCSYCRFSYGTEHVTLEAMVLPQIDVHQLRNWAAAHFGDLLFAATHLGGTLQTFTSANQQVIQVILQIPYPSCVLGHWIRIRCQLPLLQTAFTQLAYQAGLTVDSGNNDRIPLLTDDLAQATTTHPVIWIAHTRSTPRGVAAKLDLTTTPAQLRSAVEAVTRGETWGLDTVSESRQSLSEREQEILELLMQGARDRDIAGALHISERTVKFHINNLLTKLDARTRCQAIYQAIGNGVVGG
jgi:DNA-binding CsgD family transcriptional regulator